MMADGVPEFHFVDPLPQDIAFQVNDYIFLLLKLNKLRNIIQWFSVFSIFLGFVILLGAYLIFPATYLGTTVQASIIVFVYINVKM